METWSFAYYKSPIGVIKLEGNNEGVSFVDFIDENIEVEENPKDLPFALMDAINQLDEYFNGNLKEFNIKLLHKKGTEFQKSAWKALEKIPYGSTASYKDVAISINNPKAVRAVGGANNKNPHSLFVPWHRVIGANGSLVGFGGGLWRKEWLLKFEKENL